MTSHFGIVIHGGAGAIKKAKMTPELDKEYREMLKQSLTAGFDLLKESESSVDAVQAAVKVMENSELFNAGKGAVFTNDETHEMDAAVMNGADLSCGAVAGVRGVKNPIELARLVMDKSSHVLLARDGAEKFGREHGVTFMPDDYFYSERRWKQLQIAKKWGEQSSVNATELSEGGRGDEKKFGTVGAVALDQNGNLAAATSTGGMTNVRYGRVGDTPIFGAGTYANKITAVSTTGHGEFFMRVLTAYDVAAMMEYKNLPLSEASELVLKKLTDLGGSGGFIAIDNEGNFVLPFNSPGMNRGYYMNGGEPVVGIYKDE